MALSLSGLAPELRPYAQAALDHARKQGVYPDLTSVLRSYEEQAALRRRYENCVGRGLYPWASGCHYPANRPGDSAHQYGLAWDSWVPDRLMPWWVAVRRALGWTVPDNDPVHAEYPNWRSLFQ